MAHVRYIGPNLVLVLNDLVRQFMPRAGEMLKRSAQAKFGTYQPGWPPLAESTRRKKAGRRFGRRARMQRRGQVFGPMYGADTPLIDTGRMAQSINAWTAGNEAHVTVAWPMEVHEQDPNMPYTPSVPMPPQRALLGPTLDEMLDPIMHEVEDFLAVRF